MKNHTIEKLAAAAEKGQAMVEFAIMLLVFMILLSGQIYLSRVMEFQFWTQQEARFLAFEQTEVGRAGYPAGAPVGSEVLYQTDRSGFRRPEIVDTLGHTGTVTEPEGVRDLLLSQNTAASAERDEPIRKLDFLRDSSTFFASLHEPPPILDDGPLSIVSSAWASQRRDDDHVGSGLSIDNPKIRRSVIRSITPETEAEAGFVRVMRQSGIGEEFCEIAAGKFGHANYRGAEALFATQGCAQWINDGFGISLARNADIRTGFLDYGEKIEDGFSPQDALSVTVRDIVARGFYSFFDQTIRDNADNAESTINSDRFDNTTTMSGDDQFQNLLSDMRYMGSILAELAVTAGLATVNGMSVSNRNADTELTAATSLYDILHVDAKGTAGGAAYMLDPDYLPLTTLMLDPMYGGIMNGLLENVLSKDDGLKDYLIDHSNKLATSTYNAKAGLFGAMAGRFRTDGINLQSKFYLVTEPWHIPRRVTPTGDYRQLGHENDNYNDHDSDEAALKRRVVGLWLIPSNPIALLQPVMDLVDSSGTLGNLFEGGGALEIFGDSIEFFAEGAKDFICDNPLNDVLGFLDALPGFGADKDSTFPSCPAVRPAAYPHTKEISGDKLAGESLSRTFQDFVTEQIESNPRPRPQYHEDDDTATNKGGQDDEGAKACDWKD